MVVYRIADDYLPKPPQNARRKITDTETVTPCLAQPITGTPSDPRLTADRGKRLSQLFPTIPTRDAIHKPRSGCPARSRRRSRTTRLTAQRFFDELLLIDCIPVQCARPSEETVNRGGSPSLADALTDTSRTKPPIPIEDKNFRGT